ncbi:MAG: hypothetical protein DRP96_11245, partial [Candidatus Neomarinimicrobiota bacterium]
MHKDQKPIYYFVIILIIVFTELRGFEIRDGWYYIDGEKYFIKGIGYETHTRPGQVPWEYEFNAAVIEYDDAGGSLISLLNEELNARLNGQGEVVNIACVSVALAGNSQKVQSLIIDDLDRSDNPVNYMVVVEEGI